MGHPPKNGLNGARDGGWPTFAFFVKVGTARSGVTTFLCRGLAHLYVLCKGGDGEVGPDSFSLKRAQRESTSSEAKAPGRQRHESPPLPKTAKCQPPQSRSAGLGARAGAVAVEQLSELCFGRGGHGANQSVGRDKDKSPGVGSMSPHLYKERKGGPATKRLTQHHIAL